MAQSKERQIAAQSQLKLALDWANSCGYCLSIKDLVSISVVLVDYVENGYSSELKTRLEKVDSYLQEQYKDKEGQD